MTDEIHLNDVGTVFKITIKDQDGSVVDVSSASVKQIWLGKPKGGKLTKTAEFDTDGTDGVIKYTSISGDLNVTGTWEIQAHVTTPAGTWHSTIDTFEVKNNI